MISKENIRQIISEIRNKLNNEKNLQRRAEMHKQIEILELLLEIN